MSDNDKNSDAPLVSNETFTGEGGNANIIYILYLIGLALPPLILVGLIIAYVNQGNSSGWVSDHYRFQIRTFWIGFLFSFLSAILSIIIVGLFLALFTLVWWIVRCVKGLQAANRNEAPANVEGWGL